MKSSFLLPPIIALSLVAANAFLTQQLDALRAELRVLREGLGKGDTRQKVVPNAPAP